jgi:replicative DNA helicase
MTTPQDPETVILGAVLPDRVDRLEMATRRLRPKHFSGQVLPSLFAFFGNYLDLTGEVATRQALAGFLENRRVQSGTIALWLETFDAVMAVQVSDGEFKWAVEQLREMASSNATGVALSGAYEILTRGVETPKGEKVVGPDAARQYVMEKFAEIDADLNQAEAPEGDIRQERAQIISRYAATAERVKRAGGMPGIATGIAPLDRLLGGGVQSGEFALVAGFSSSGKTSLCVSTTWNACVVQGKNVVLFTSETLRPQVINKIISRHSRHPQWVMEMPDGIDSARIRAGSLSGPEIAQYQEVLDDFTDNPAYGKCFVAQLPFGATVGTVASRLARIGHLFEVHLCIIDYVQLLRADQRRDASHEEAAQIVKDVKAIAATFGSGTGVPVISPWQVNRPGRDRALKEGSYSGVDLASTSEAFNSPDIVITLLEPQKIENPRGTPVKGELLKNRDGPRGAQIPLKVDYATSFFQAEDDVPGGQYFAPGTDYGSSVLMGGRR